MERSSPASPFREPWWPLSWWRTCRTGISRGRDSPPRFAASASHSAGPRDVADLFGETGEDRRCRDADVDREEGLADDVVRNDQAPCHDCDESTQDPEAGLRVVGRRGSFLLIEPAGNENLDRGTPCRTPEE